MICCSFLYRVKSPRLRSRSSSLSIGRTGSSNSLMGDEVFTVETLQLSRFDPTPDEAEEAPDCIPVDITAQPSEHLIVNLEVRYWYNLYCSQIVIFIYDKTETNYSAKLHILHRLMKLHGGTSYMIDHS